MAWDETKFRNKVYADAAAQNRSVRSVLTDAGLALDFFEKVPSQGRRIDTLDRIATALGYIDYLEMMGAEPRITDELMSLAWRIVRRALRRVINSEEATPHALTTAYNVLLRYKHEGRPTDDPALATMLERSLAEQYGSAVRPRGSHPTK